MPNESETRVKIDLHVHTVFSQDSLITTKLLVSWARKAGLTGVAVTDHDCVDGALKVTRETDYLVIPGIEVSSSDGHVLGLNVREVIPKGLSSEETIDRIHEVGGLAVACHPFALFKGSLGRHASSKFDAVETINASAFPFKRSVRKAEAVASEFNLPRVAGTDAHYAPAIGLAYTNIEAEPDVDRIVKAIANRRCHPCGVSIPLRLKLEKYLHYLK